jgi:hypothetical protein
MDAYLLLHTAISTTEQITTSFVPRSDVFSVSFAACCKKKTRMQNDHALLCTRLSDTSGRRPVSLSSSVTGNWSESSNTKVRPSA